MSKTTASPRWKVGGGRRTVATLPIESGRRIPGRLEVANLGHLHVDDLLDDLGALVEKMGGRVMVIPAEQLPGRTGLVTTY